MKLRQSDDLRHSQLQFARDPKTIRKSKAAPPRGLMMPVLFDYRRRNSELFPEYRPPGILIAALIGALGVFTLAYSTSNVLRSPYIDRPIPGALMLFAGVFNAFVATLNILLRVLGGSRR
jgi:hypothetical protein